MSTGRVGAILVLVILSRKRYNGLVEVVYRRFYFLDKLPSILNCLGDFDKHLENQIDGILFGD
jgi:hypothetical protein